jgi:hypothetical protein
MSIVFIEKSVAMQYVIPERRERNLMPRLHFLSTSYITCALLSASIMFVVQNGYTCNWYAELIDYTAQETTRFSLDATPVKIPIVQAEKGVDVRCSLDLSDVLSIGILKQQKVDVLCRYPDDQMITARAITTFDIFTGDTITHPVMLFFSNVRKYDETLYRLYVDCQ